MIQKFFIFACLCIGSLTALTPQEVDHLVETALEKWEIPGIALATVHNGKGHAQGYGVCERGTDKRVDTATLFPINSLTKAFTVLAVQLLVGQGKLDWDAPIRNYVPDFQLKDPNATEQLSLRDLLCHRSGLPGNLQEGWRFYCGTGRTVREMLQRWAFVDLVFPFRDRFNYDNTSYAVAGELVSRISGVTWEDYCSERIFVPLCMERTTCSYNAYLTDENSAMPHPYKSPAIQGYNWEADHMQAASGIISCAQDMVNWLHCCLNVTDCFVEAFKPHMPVKAEFLFNQSELPLFAQVAHGQHELYYGMGWWSYDLQGKRVYRHTGSSPGMQSVLALVPEHELGIVILSNQRYMGAVSALMNELLDAYLDQPKTDWQSLALQAAAETEQNEKQRLEKLISQRNQDILPSLPLSKYTGTYTHPAYGSILIEENALGLEVELLFCRAKGMLSHWKGDRFTTENAPSEYPKPIFYDFMVSPDGSVTGLEIEGMGIFLLLQDEL
jgi:CubicO group peptidase (beta-lactamase class C family)